MKRILGLALLALGLVLAILSWWPDPAAPVFRGRRSVLLVTLDTTRADHLGPYGAEDVETPNLDRFAREGTTLEHAFAVAPITLPAHTSILTGKYPYQTGVRNNGTHRVPNRITTLAERLLAVGYRTGAFVSASVLESRYGLDRGFEVYDDDLSAGRERHARVVPDRPAEATVGSARAWLDLLGEHEPFFCWVHLYDPHAVYSPPPPFRDRYQGRLYDGEIAYMDDQIGSLLAHPRVAGDPDLVVVIVGDHGESLGEHGERTHGILAYDATLRVPLLVRARGLVPGSRIDEQVSQVDILPTLLDLLDLDAEQDLPGRSLLPLLETGKWEPSREIYSEAYLPYYTYGWAQLRVLHAGRWKLIAAPEPELYDLKRDPRELSNLAKQHPGPAHDLQRDLSALVADSEPIADDASLDLDRDSLERLRSLGYIAMGSLPPRKDERRPDPKSVIELHSKLERARTYLDDGLFENAEVELRAALSRDPTNIAFLRELGAALEGQRRFGEAVDAVEEALALDPNAVSLYVTLSRLENLQGEREKALELVEIALERDPGFLEARLQKAMVLSSLGRADEARAVLEDTLKREPDDPRANLLYAQLIEGPAGDWPAAEARLKRALARDPFMAGAWLRLGQAQQQQGRLEEAAASFLEGLKRAPDSADLHASYGTLLASSAVAGEVEQHLREAIRLSPTFRAETHVTLGAWLTEHGRPQEALREYELVLQRRPRDSSALNNRAIALFQLGRVDEAERDLLALTREVPGHANAFNNLAAISLSREDWDSMEGRARRALELDPTMVEAWSNLGIALSREGQLEEAERALRKALDLEPTYWQARFNLAFALSRAGRAEEAAELYSEVLDQDPSLPDVYLELGEIYSGPLDDPERARDYLNAFLRRVDPGDPRASEVRERLMKLPGRSSGA